MSEFEHRSKEEQERDTVVMVLGIWGVFLTLVLLPLPLAMITLTGISIVAKDDVGRAGEWLLRNTASRARFLDLTLSLFTYPVRLLHYHLHTALWPLYREIDKSKLLKYTLAFIILFGVTLAWLTIVL